jgi:homoserine kinase type II
MAEGLFAASCCCFPRSARRAESRESDVWSPGISGFWLRLANAPEVDDTAPMAVYTVLSDDFVRAMVSVYPELNGPPPGVAVVEVTGMEQGSINTTYRVRLADGAVWFLRVNEGKPWARLIRERDLLDALGTLSLGVTTPRMARSVAGSAFFAVDVDGGERRWASFFAGLPGRELGTFEVSRHHVESVGLFLARCHRRLRRFRAGANPYGDGTVHRWLERLRAYEPTRADAHRLATTLIDVHASQPLLPRGVIHGDLFVDNTRWSPSGTLLAVFDWEMAGRDALLLDVAIVLCAWTFHRVDGQLVWREDLAATLVDAYQRVRPFSDSERRGLFGELRRASVRFAASRMVDFVLPRPVGAVAARRFLDPADFLQRLDLIEGRGERGVLRLVGLSPERRR